MRLNFFHFLINNFFDACFDVKWFWFLEIVRFVLVMQILRILHALCNLCIFLSQCLHFRFELNSNLNSSLWHLYTDLSISRFFEFMLFNLNLSNLVYNLYILHCSLAYLSNLWLFWLKLLLFDFILTTNLLFVFNSFVSNFLMRYLIKNW